MGYRAGDHRDPLDLRKNLVLVLYLDELDIEVADVGVVKVETDDAHGNHFLTLWVEGKSGVGAEEGSLGVGLPGDGSFVDGADGVVGEEDEEDGNHQQGNNSSRYSLVFLILVISQQLLC